MLRLAALVCLWLAAVSPAWAAERIAAFDSRIAVDANGELLVKETITVNAEGDKIRRGIYRDFPTVRGKTWLGTFKTSFDVVSVTRDGANEPWRTSGIKDGVRLYIGDADRLLARGQYTYVVTYKTDRQIGFFSDHDELYWNVTGNFWSFPIARVTGAVDLPHGATAKDAASYSGAVGGKGNTAQIEKTAAGVTFSHTQGLSPGEGLTIVVSWDKGFVTPPNAAQRAAYAARDNAGLLAAFTSLLLVGAYYLLTWWHYGRDPDRGTIIAQYDPPRAMSPAACRYLLHMDWDEKAFTGAIMHMAARGYLTMAKLSDGVFTLTKTGVPGGEAGLPAGERAIAKKLFGTWNSVALRPDRHKEISGAMKGLRDALEQEHDRVHLIHNGGTLMIGAALSLISLVAVAVLSADKIVDIFVGLGLGVLALFVYTWVKGASIKVREATAIVKSFALGFIGLLFVGAMNLIGMLVSSSDEIENITSSIDGGDISLTTSAFAIVIINLIFFEIMKAPTARGRKLMDEIEGFRHYLTVAEKDRLNFHNPPALTPARFEAFLPYAVALDVENDWGEQFHAAMTRAAHEQGTTWNDADYSPGWYDGRPGRSWFGRDSSWSDVSKSFGQSVAVAAVSPSQASGLGSGLGGGGFSGGGGGGGGGGGW